MNKEVRNKEISVYVSELEYFGLSELASKQNVSISELIRKCTLTDFINRQIYLRLDDCFDMNMFVNTIGKNTERILFLMVKEGKLFEEEYLSIRQQLKKIINKSVLLYDRVEKCRNKIKAYLLEYLKNNKEQFYNNYKVSARDERNLRIQVRATSEEYAALKEMAAKADLTISRMLVSNVFIKCVDEKIEVDSYNLDNMNKGLKNKLVIYNAMINDLMNRRINENDIKVAQIILNQANDMIEECYQSVSSNKRIIQKEAKRILSERSKKDGDSQDKVDQE